MNGYIRQRSPGSWELTVNLGLDADRRRRRHRETFHGTRAQAQRRLRELHLERDRGRLVPTGGLPLGEWLERWMRDVVVPQRRQSTRARYEGVIRRHIAPALGHVAIDRLTPAHVQDLELRLSAGGMAAKGVSVVHGVLSGAMRHAQRLELVQRNPVALVAAPPYRRGEGHAPDVADVLALLRLARNTDHPLQACVHLIAYTGLRRGEALALTWASVDLDAGRILVNASLVRGRAGELLVEPPKTAAGRRVVDLGAETVDVLREHRLRQHELKETMLEAYEDRGRVFAGPCGEWVTPAQLTWAVRSLGRRVGRPDMTVRSLRHFHATVALQSGQNPVVVSKRLGHANVSITTDVYAHALPGWQKQLAEDFERVMVEA